MDRVPMRNEPRPWIRLASDARLSTFVYLIPAAWGRHHGVDMYIRSGNSPWGSQGPDILTVPV